MANPTLNASLNKASYEVGETMTLTVDYSDADQWNRTDTMTITGTDQDGNAVVATIETTITSEDEVLLTITDSSGRVWNKQSDDGARATYTAAA